MSGASRMAKLAVVGATGAVGRELVATLERRRFPLTELKIDRSFVIAADKSEEDASLVIAIIAMAHGLGLEVVVEGVETSDQYHFINEHGAKVIQGYLFSAPVPVEEFAELLRPWHFVRQLQDLDGHARQMPG